MKIILSALAIFAFDKHLDPTVVSVGKEPARSHVVSHDSREAAVLQRGGASKYLQPLTEWTRTQSADAVTFSARFKIPFAWIDRQQFLYIERASGSYSVVINGVEAAYSQNGGSPGEFDITKIAKEGINTLEIEVFRDPIASKLENLASPREPRLEGEIYILSQPRVRVRDVAISTRMEGTAGLLELGVILKSHQLNNHNYLVQWELLNPAGEIVAEGKKATDIEMRREDTVRFFANIARIIPWSHERPQLYTLHIATVNEGRTREHVAFRMGFRNENVQLSDIQPVDVVAPTRQFLDRADSAGIYVMARADIDTRRSGSSRRVGGNPSNDPEWTVAYIERTLAMYHTAKNHPSVTAFSLARHSANGYNLYETYLTLKQLERVRPVVYADGGGEWNSDPLITGVASPTSPQKGLALESVDMSAGRFRIANLLIFTPFAGEVHYRIQIGRKLISSGSVPVEVMPGAASEFAIPVTGIDVTKRFTVTLSVVGERTDGNFLPAADPALRIYRRAPTPESGIVLLTREF